MKAFISGGGEDGETTAGQDLVGSVAAGGTHYYVATMISADAEDDERIRRHIADRAGLGFETIECPRHILSCLDTADRNGVFLLDSVTALLQNEIFPPEKNYAPELPAAERCMRELLKFVRSVRSAVLVSDYIFSDAGEYDPMTERYRRALAGIDRMLARECDTVVELAAGRRIVHKGVLPF